MNTSPIIVERTLNAPADAIWAALTDRDKMKDWYFDLEKFVPEVGFEFRFEGGPPEKSYLHICKVTEVIPNKKIAYTWRYDGYPGNSLVTFELFAEGDKTRLKLTHAGLETFGTENPHLAPHNFEAGWNDIINRSLVEYLAK